MEAADLWDERHRGTPTGALSWYQPHAGPSLELIDELGIGPADSVIDVGGGASTLVDALLDRGFRDLTVLDVSDEALGIARSRVSPDASVDWIVADATDWTPTRTWALWHDRAAFHFLTDTAQRDRYLRALDAAVTPGGAVVMATFAPDGPPTCSGLPVERYSTRALLQVLRTHVDVELSAERRELHRTPSGSTQAFSWVACRRR